MTQDTAHQGRDTIKPTMKLPRNQRQWQDKKLAPSKSLRSGQPKDRFQESRFIVKADPRPRKGKDKIKVTVLSICWFGLLCHLILTTVEYFSYEMVTSTFIYSPDEMIPPAMSFCVYIPAFSEYEDVTKQMKCEDDYYAAQQSCMNEFSLNSLMNNFTSDISNYINFLDFGCYKKVSDKNDYFRRKTFHYYFSKYKCLVIPGSIGSEIVNDHYYNGTVPKGVDLKVVKREMIEEDLENNFFLDFMVNMREVTQSGSWAFVTLFFHDSKNIGHNRDFHFVRYYWDTHVEPNVARLNYHQITTQYLKYPFKHNCYDYAKDEKFQSKGHCLELCKENELYKKYGEVGRVVSTSSFDDFIPHIHPPLDVEIESKCKLQCRVDCKTIIYNPILDFLWTNSENWNWFRVQWLSSYPQTFITFSPKIHIFEYLIYIGGIFGMWIGLDLLILASTAIDGLIKALKKCLNKI